ncbi:hypothetical protein Tco_1137751, partial [Tanacetum coccineum]
SSLSECKAPPLSKVKRAGGTAYDYTSTAAAKIDQVVRVDGIQKLVQYLSDSESKAQISIFTAKLAKNARKYTVIKGFKHILGLYSLSSIFELQSTLKMTKYYK